MGMFMMTSASLSDARGRRKAYTIGIVHFCVASVGCGLAPNVGVLTVTRALQGAGAAIVNVASLALVGAAYSHPSDKAKAVGLWTGIAGIGIAIGPTVGGILSETIGWRWIFLVNPFVGVVALALTFAFVRESTDDVGHSFDPGGQVLFLVGIGALTYALVQTPQHGFGSPAIFGPLVGGWRCSAPSRGSSYAAPTR
jgi:MFS family permease